MSSLPRPPPLPNTDGFARLNTILQRLNSNPFKFTVTRHVTYQATISLEALDPHIQELLSGQNTAPALAKVLRTKLSRGKKAGEERTAKEALAREVSECLEIALAAKENKQKEADVGDQGSASGQCRKTSKRKRVVDDNGSEDGEVREERTSVGKRHKRPAKKH